MERASKVSGEPVQGTAAAQKAAADHDYTLQMSHRLLLDGSGCCYHSAVCWNPLAASCDGASCDGACNAQHPMVVGLAVVAHAGPHVVFLQVPSSVTA